MVVNVWFLVARLETGRDRVFRDIVVGVFARHGGYDGARWG